MPLETFIIISIKLVVVNLISDKQVKAETWHFWEIKMNFTDLVQRYINLARRKHPIGMHSAHEAYGVIAEELDEFWELVKKDGDKKDMLEELAHTAAMCQRAAEDLNLLG